MTRSLYDVNVLLALFDEEHPHHERAQAWRRSHLVQEWATCPLTQNGYLRIVSQPRYANRLILSDAIQSFHEIQLDPSHQFWPDDLSLVDASLIDHSQIAGPNQLTDIYLLALAVRNGGRLVTFDRSIPLAAVRGAAPDHLVQL